MKRLLQFFMLLLVVTLTSLAQEKSSGINMITSVDPVFPAEAKNFIYGETIRVTVNVDKDGKVTAANSLGPMSPCSNLKDPIIKEIQDAAILAAKQSVFQPILKDGTPVETGLTLTYRLRSKDVTPPSSVDRKIDHGGVINGKAISLPKPSYPDAAKKDHITGIVEVAVQIAEDGRIISAGVISGHPAFAEEAIKTACKARYSPTLFNGQPVKVMGAISYNFLP